jgi:hypothetical protein
LWAVVAVAQRGGPEGIRVERMRADVTFLSSSPLAGRKALERGSDVAVQFIAAEFAKAGLKPGNGDSYLQEFPLIEYRSKARGLSLERGGKKQEYQSGRDFTGSFPRNVTAAGALVFAGYGITAPEFGYDDYAGLDVQGKVVLIFDHEPQENDPKSVFSGLGNTRYASPQYKLLNAQRHGAVGVLTAAEPNRKHPSSLERMARVPGGRERAVSPAAQALAESDRRIPVFSVSDAVLAELLAPSGKKPGELQSAIDGKLKPVSCALADTRVELRVQSEEVRRAATANVVGLLEGRDPKLRGETVLFTAHYDHLGMRGDQVLPGADDNASGTAGLLELARVFAQEARRAKRSLLFVAFGAEEPGLLGSYYYTAHPLRPLGTTLAVINMDMIGRDERPSKQTEGLIEIAADTSNELNLIGLRSQPKLRALIGQQNRQVGLRLNDKWEDDAALSVLWRCDHFPFILADVPAVWLFNGFTPDYHQPTDTVEKLDFAKMQKIVRLAYRVGRAVAEGGFAANQKAKGKNQK